MHHAPPTHPTPPTCRDGESHNLSWNCGAEGPTPDPAVNSLRQRQVRRWPPCPALPCICCVFLNFHALRVPVGCSQLLRPPHSLTWVQMRNLMTALLVAHGVPMINMGDEYGHT